MNNEMKTFDIALQHLKGIDFKSVPIIVKKEEPYVFDNILELLIKKAKQDYNNDIRNNKSNDYYRNICFFTAMLHLTFKAHGWVSFFDVACEIVEAFKDSSVTKELYLKTAYPKVMVDEWIKYCEGVKLKTDILESEIRENLFFTAYHYILEPEIA